MEQIKQKAGAVLGLLCTALLGIAVIGNLFVGNVEEQAVIAAGSESLESAVWEQQYTDEQIEKAAETAALQNKTNDSKEVLQIRQLDNRVAALRMERDQSWQKLQNRLNDVQTAEKTEWMNRYTMLQYKEQRLELLLQARGIAHCIVILEENQANIIVAEEELPIHYEQLYDLVQRNSDYTAEQIILIPLRI